MGLSASKISQPCRVTALNQARTRTEALADDLCGVRGREAPPSWRDDGPVLKGSLTRSGAEPLAMTYEGWFRVLGRPASLAR